MSHGLIPFSINPIPFQCVIMIPRDAPIKKMGKIWEFPPLLPPCFALPCLPSAAEKAGRQSWRRACCCCCSGPTRCHSWVAEHCRRAGKPGGRELQEASARGV